jgi:predicted ester cyclase
MSTESSKQFLRRYAAALNGSDKSRELVEQFVDDESLKEHIEVFEAAFPGYDLEVNDMVAEDNKVAIRATFHGVHRGEFQGIPPTGREISVPLMLIYRIAGDKIVEHWLNADSLGLLQQLGAVPVLA